MRIYDVSVALRQGLASWPGDAAFQHVWTCKKSQGATVNVSEMRLSVHTGTHVDAPFHFSDEGATAADLSLEPFFGPAIVIDVRGRPLIRIGDLDGHDLSRAPRVLLRTSAWPDKTHFPDSIPTLGSEVPSWLGDKGVMLFGIDVPSVDAIDSKDLPIHHGLSAAGICILESLDLDAVPEGIYELVALPLKIVGSDGAPVRAILREIKPAR